MLLFCTYSTIFSYIMDVHMYRIHILCNVWKWKPKPLKIAKARISVSLSYVYMKIVWKIKPYKSKYKMFICTNIILDVKWTKKKIMEKLMSWKWNMCMKRAEYILNKMNRTPLNSLEEITFMVRNFFFWFWVMV